jgi:hypothetical protein
MQRRNVIHTLRVDIRALPDQVFGDERFASEKGLV